MVPERKLTPEDVKYVLSSHYQGTPFDPYASYGDKSMKGAYRSIGINRNDFMALIQMRPDLPEDIRAVEWIAYAKTTKAGGKKQCGQKERFGLEQAYFTTG